MKKIIIATILATSLVGCASVPMGDPKKDSELKAFSIPADKAGVYIYRNESLGAVARMDVELDGSAIGQTAAHSYLYKEIAPGKHTVVSKAENTDTLEFEAKPGTLTFVWQEVKMGIFSPRTKLHLVNEADGKQGVQESDLAETK